jgi:hypothetical protein
VCILMKDKLHYTIRSGPGSTINKRMTLESLSHLLHCIL